VLAKIGEHYAKFAGLAVSELHGGALSVANQWTPSGQKYPNQSSLYNDGKVARYEGESAALMHHRPSIDAITFQLQDGKVHELLNDGNNMISTLYHEGQHRKYTSNDQREHVSVYFDQVTHSSFHNTTPNYKDAMLNNARNEVNYFVNFNHYSKSAQEKQRYREEGLKMRARFEKAGIASKPKVSGTPKSKQVPRFK